MLVIVSRIFFKDFIYFQIEGNGERKKERNIDVRKKHQFVVASHTLPTVDLAHNPGMHPDWESNR